MSTPTDTRQQVLDLIDQARRALDSAATLAEGLDLQLVIPIRYNITRTDDLWRHVHVCTMDLCNPAPVSPPARVPKDINPRTNREG